MSEEVFWHRPPAAIAQALIGKTLILGDTAATVLQAQGYGRRDNAENGLYKPLLEIEPGSVYCPRRRNAVLLLLATVDQGEWGGCVLVQTVENEGVMYEGPGRVTDRLGIRTHATRGKASFVDEDSLVLDLEGEQPTPRRSVQRRQMIKPGNGIGEESLRRLMPDIANAYLREKPSECSFHDFINRLLGECKTVRHLRGRLR